MDKDKAFTYSYSAAANREIQAIRKKYIHEESKIEELRRLDREVQDAGMLISLILGVGGFLVFGLGLGMAIDIIGGGITFGSVICAIGTAAMIAAYPAGLRMQSIKRAENAPRILQLTEELMLEGK